MPKPQSFGGGTFALTTAAGPYIGGSAIPLGVSGIHGPLAFSVIGPGSIEDGLYQTPMLTTAAQATLIAATPFDVALRELQIVPPPAPKQEVIAVASYASGIALHRESDFALIGIIATDGPPGDVAMSSAGNIFAPLTDATTMIAVSRSPWTVAAVANVPVGNEIVVDNTTGAIFVSNRDIGGRGGLTRVLGEKVQRIDTGITAEGLALNEHAGRIYVGNVNDGTILEVDTRSFLPVRRIKSVERTFGLALDSGGHTLFVVSNQNQQMRRGGGYIARIDLRPAAGRITARSPNIPFPVGVAYDPKASRVFATDENSGKIYVLDAVTLKQRHRPITSCALPWRPRIDARRRRLYVPCARANEIAVYNLDTLRAVPGSPFATGNYPLGVAISNK
ncbi:MAG: YncE family protein [Candidatus Baltobacteraceae bacterium]